MASFFGRKKKFIINEPDPEYHVIYLGNVLTSMAKGDVEKPLDLIWRTYCSRTRPDLPMMLTISNTGLKALTKQQGLTEYWAHRITWCLAPANYPKIFCWIYKHEGKKMKPELRCHAALCKKIDQPGLMVSSLQNRITAALIDYKREKVTRQNLRLSTSVLGYRSVPMRRLMLSTSGQNFRPPMTRSKSAPRLHSINEEEPIDDDEVEVEEEEYDVITSNGHSTDRRQPKAASSTVTAISYFAQLSADSAYNEQDFDDVQDENSPRLFNSRSPHYQKNGGKNFGAQKHCLPSSNLKNAAGNAEYRRNSTFSFMQIIETEEEAEEEELEPEPEPESESESGNNLLAGDVKKLSISSNGSVKSTKKENGRQKEKAEDSISDESGYHEEKISSSEDSDRQEKESHDEIFTDIVTPF